jgi:hypothetical protein
MIEIAIALGVIGFALVAIIGILPIGMQVQRDNRTETIINQDGTFWLEAIRNGAQGLDELPQYVEKIVITNGAMMTAYSGNEINSGAKIIGLLTTQAAISTADVRAYVSAISGAASEKEPNIKDRDLTFRYVMKVQIQRATNNALSFVDQVAGSLAPGGEPLDSLYHVRLIFDYPLINEQRPPLRRQAFRALASRQVYTNDVILPGTELYFFTQ